MDTNKSFINSKKAVYIWGSFSLVLYAIWAYKLARFEHFKLLGLYSLLFICYYLILKNTKIKSRYLTYLAIGFRLVFLVALPNLSQDFYRFIWDGRLILEGLNPYITKPDLLLIQPDLFPQMKLLYEGMGPLSASH